MASSPSANKTSARLPKKVSDQTLKDIYELAKWGPTSANLGPARFIFVKSDAQKAKLLAAIPPTNADKVKSAPVTVIIAQDEKFYNESAKLFPHFAAIKDYFASNAIVSDLASRSR